VNHLKSLSFFVITLVISMAAPQFLWAQEDPSLFDIDEDVTDIQDDNSYEEGEILDQIEELNRFSDQNSGLKPFVYSERGRKSPFQRPNGVKIKTTDLTQLKSKQTGLEGYDLDAFQVTTVLWSIKHPKALVKSPNNEVYEVEEGTKIGRNSGYVAKIREGEIVVVETTMPNGESGQKFYKTQVLKLGR